jgi:acyl-CoA thioesterase I
VALRYVALGDSYTIGTGVQPADRWPDRLVATLARAEPTLELVANLAVDGYATDELIRHELPALDGLAPGFISVLVAVNDVVRGRSPGPYVGNVRTILDDVSRRVGPDRVFAVAVPDYTVTPAGADYGHPRRQHDAIVAVNEAMARETADRGIAFVDIFDLSLRAAEDRTLVADDGLHPSGRQYGLWVERIAPVVARLIGRE